MNKQQALTPEAIEMNTSSIDRMQPKLPAASEMLHLVGRVVAYIGDAQARGLSPEEIDEEFRKMGYPIKTKTRRSAASGARPPRRRSVLAPAPANALHAPLEPRDTMAIEKGKTQNDRPNASRLRS